MMSMRGEFEKEAEDRLTALLGMVGRMQHVQRGEWEAAWDAIVKPLAAGLAATREVEVECETCGGPCRYPGPMGGFLDGSRE